MTYSLKITGKVQGVCYRAWAKGAARELGLTGFVRNDMKRDIFTNKVLNVVSQIPRGTVLTYKEVAERAGSPGAYRAVGSIMKHNLRRDVPCHRVIKSDLSLGGYNRGGTRVKKQLLQKENVDFYWDQGRLTGRPSTLIKPEKNDILILRSGSVASPVLRRIYRLSKV